MKSEPERAAARCRATSKSGERCRKQAVKDGLCLVHDPSSGFDAKALGKRSGEARRRRVPDPELERETLKAYLRREVPPREVWAALKTAMEGSNQAAAVSAARVLLAALEEPERDKEEHDHAAEHAAAREKFDRMIDHALTNAIVALVNADEDRLRCLPGGLRRVAERFDLTTKAKIAELNEERRQVESELERLRQELEHIRAQRAEFVT
jgi:Family of unknown function (DUF5763)